MAEDVRPKLDLSLGKEIPSPKSTKQRLKEFFSPQVNAAIVGWLLAVVSGIFLFKGQGRIQELRDETSRLRADLGKLTTEKASLESRMATYSAIPLQIPIIISNLDYVVSHDPTNRQQLAEVFFHLSSLGTNLVSELESFKPVLDLGVNGSKAEVWSVIQSPDRLTFDLMVTNIGPITAEHTMVSVKAPLHETNVLATGWSCQAPASLKGYYKLLNGKLLWDEKPFGQWVVECQYTLANRGSFWAPRFSVTNFDGITLPLEISIQADRTIAKSYFLICMLPGATNFLTFEHLGDATFVIKKQ